MISPERMNRFIEFGTFNITRIPISSLVYSGGFYYAAGLLGSHYHILIDIYDEIEGPLAPPILAAPLLVILATLGLPSMLRNALSAAAFAGHVISGLLLLAALYVATRYGFDFIGLFLLPAAFGYREASMILANANKQARQARLAIVIVFLVFGIGVSQYQYIVASVANAAVPTAFRCAWQPLAPFMKLWMWTAVPTDVIGTTPPGCVVISAPPV
jgi:hypothetical protein